MHICSICLSLSICIYIYIYIYLNTHTYVYMIHTYVYEILCMSSAIGIRCRSLQGWPTWRISCCLADDPTMADFFRIKTESFTDKGGSPIYTRIYICIDIHIWLRTMIIHGLTHIRTISHNVNPGSINP